MPYVILWTVTLLQATGIGLGCGAGGLDLCALLLHSTPLTRVVSLPPADYEAVTWIAGQDALIALSLMLLATAIKQLGPRRRF